MNLAVVGSRSFVKFSTWPKAQAQDIIRNKVRNGEFKTIVSGGAEGPDQWAEEVAVQFGLKMCVYKPDWSTYGKSAGIRRNYDIITNSDLVLLFWDGESKGTKHDLTLVNEKKTAYELFVWNYFDDKWGLKEKKCESDY